MRIEVNSPHIKQKDLENNITLPVIVKVIGEFNEESAKSLYADCDRNRTKNPSYLYRLLWWMGRLTRWNVRLLSIV